MRASEMRSLARLGRRAAWRNWKRTVLIVSLVAIPVAAAQVTAGMIAAGKITSEEFLRREIGDGDIRINLMAAPRDLEDRVRAEIDLVAPGARIVEYHTSYLRLEGPEGRGGGLVTDLDITEPLMSYSYGLTDGRLPTGAGEVAISDGASLLVGAGIGDAVTLSPGAGTEPLAATVVGLVRDQLSRSMVVVIVSPAGFDVLRGFEEASGPQDRFIIETYFVIAGADVGALVATTDRMRGPIRAEYLPEAAITPRPPALRDMAEEIYHSLTADEIERLVAMAPTTDPWELEQAAADLLSARNGWIVMPQVWANTRSDFSWYVDGGLGGEPVTMGVVIAALLMAEVALVAGAAYATGARRRLREMGLMSANGATTQHLKWTVIGEGLVAGVAGAAIGTGIGIAAMTAGRPVMQRFVDRLIVGFPLNPLELLAPAVVGVVGVVLAAWIPARTAARVPTTTALEGRMPLTEPARWVVPLGVAVAAFGAFLLAVARSAFGSSGILQAVVAVATMIAGFAILSGPMVAAVGRRADRFRSTVRLMLRDAARQRTRAATAVAATMVVLVAPIVLGSSLLTEQARRQVFGLPSDRSHVFVDLAGLSQAGITFRDQVADLAVVLPEARQHDVTTFAAVAYLPSSVPPGQAPPAHPGQQLLLEREQDNLTMGVALATPGLLDAAGAAGITDDVVVLGIADRQASVVIDGQALSGTEVAATVLEWGFPRVLISASVVEALGLEIDGGGVLFVNPTPLTERERVEAAQVGGMVLFDWSGGPSAQQIMLIAGAAALLIVLLIVGLVTALSATESDHDLRTMVAIGAPPRMRRAFLGLQGAYYTLFAALLATPLALLLMKVAAGGVFSDQGPFGYLAPGTILIPWAMVGMVVLVIPGVVGLFTAAVMRSAPTVAPRRLG